MFKGENQTITNQIILHWTEVSALKKDLYTSYELPTIYTELPAMREQYVQRSRVLAHCRILSMLYTYDIFSFVIRRNDACVWLTDDLIELSENTSRHVEVNTIKYASFHVADVNHARVKVHFRDRVGGSVAFYESTS